MRTNDIFKPDRNQAIAVVAMIAAVFLFATGEVAFGVAGVVVAALFSIGGLFRNAHRQDQAAAAALDAAKTDATKASESARGVATSASAASPATPDQGPT